MSELSWTDERIIIINQEKITNDQNKAQDKTQDNTDFHEILSFKTIFWLVTLFYIFIIGKFMIQNYGRCLNLPVTMKASKYNFMETVPFTTTTPQANEDLVKNGFDKL